jgi:hypothetical protein
MGPLREEVGCKIKMMIGFLCFLGCVWAHHPRSSFIFPVLSNCILLGSCDLLRYEEGSLGLRSYTDEETGECIAFVTLEDEALKTAQFASYIALVVGIVILFGGGTVYTFLQPIPALDMLFGICSMFLEVCLLGVYTAQNNGVCKIEGCSWGTGTIWLVITQLAFIAPSLRSCLASKRFADSDHTGNRRSLYSSINNASLRRSHQRMNLGLELDN